MKIARAFEHKGKHYLFLWKGWFNIHLYCTDIPPLKNFHDLVFRANPNGSNFPFAKLQLTNEYEVNVVKYHAEPHSTYYEVNVVKGNECIRSISYCCEDEVSAIMERIQTNNGL